MDITWHGHSCFSIKGKDASVVTDPYVNLGNSLPKLKANIVTLAAERSDHESDIASVEGDPKILDWPGEFEVSGVSIESLNPNGDKEMIFLFQIDGIKIAHLSHLSHELSDDILDRLGDVDILLVPVGGNIVLDGKTAQKVVEAIEPRVVIPMFYAATETKLKISGPEEFLKAVGKTELEPVEKFSVSARSSLPEESMEFVLLSPKD